MGYANQLIGGGDGRDRARAPGRRGRERRHRRGPHARRRGARSRRSPRRQGSPSSTSSRRRPAPTAAPAIAARTGGFLYCVSLVGVTGAGPACRRRSDELVREVKAVSPAPVAVGFGVSKPAHVRAIARAGADGVIVASALVDALGPDGRDVRALGRLVALAACGHRPPPRGDRLTDTRAMPDKRIAVYLETTDKKVFACAQDWPGWCRAGKDEELALAGAGRRRAAVREGREAGEGRLPGGDAAATASRWSSASPAAPARRSASRARARRPTGGPSMPPRRTGWRRSSRPHGRSSTAPALGLRSPSGRVRVAAAVTATR